MNSRRLVPWLLAALLAIGYSAVSLTRHWRMETSGFDLGIFDEAVRGYARSGVPTAALKGTGFSVLGDHFSPVLALLAPFYRVFPDASTLLVAQAVLLALSAVPVTRLAVELLGRAGGLAIGLAYGLSWGLWRALLFDFHEVAFAVPLAAFALAALARGRHRAAVCWALPLLLVKEDQGLLLAGVGIYLFCRGSRRLGAATVLTAVLGTVLIVTVLIPAFNPLGGYFYTAPAEWNGSNPLGRLLLPGVKWITVLTLLAPTLFLALRSPLAALAVLPLAARFWSLTPIYWECAQHYNAVLMPVLFTAMLDGLRRTGWPGRTDQLRWCARAVPVLALLVAVCTVPVPDLGAPGPAVAAIRRALAVIPDGATVAASNRLAPQLTDRCTVSLFPSMTYPGAVGPWDRPTAYWVATLDPLGDFPVPQSEQLRDRAALTAAGYRLVTDEGGVRVYRWTAG